MAPRFAGFSRILISDQGDAWPAAKAIQAGIMPAIAFLRNDDWVLGAPKDLEWQAYKMYADQWIGFCRLGESEYKPMSLYGD